MDLQTQHSELLRAFKAHERIIQFGSTAGQPVMMVQWHFHRRSEIKTFLGAYVKFMAPNNIDFAEAIQIQLDQGVHLIDVFDTGTDIRCKTVLGNHRYTFTAKRLWSPLFIVEVIEDIGNDCLVYQVTLNVTNA